MNTVRGDAQIARILGMNNPGVMTLRGTSGPFAGGLSMTAAERLEAGHLSAYGQKISDNFAAGVSMSNGERRLATTLGVRGKYSQTFMRGMLTSGGGEAMMSAEGLGARSIMFAGEERMMTNTFERFAKPLAGAFEKSAALRSRAVGAGLEGATNSLIPLSAEAITATTEKMAMGTVQKGIIKTLGRKGAMEAIGAGGARVGLAVGAEAVGMMIPGLNMIMAADMAYNLAKLGGLGIKGAINFGKDAMKSMQGNISGGMFGSYKDDEVRSTSRARGVMAIQNSQLNARSLLGSEGAMMAAHFG
jgi:hypothetical protein